MDKIQILDKKFKLFIPYEKLDAAIDRVASELNNDFKECDDVPVMLCVLNGSIMFMSELMKRVNFDCQLISINLSSYEGTQTSGKV